MKKYLKLSVAVCILLLFAGTFVFLYFKSQPQATTYDELKPAVKDINKTTIITGKIEPRDEVDIKPQISGIITEVYKQAGDVVKVGEVIARVS